MRFMRDYSEGAVDISPSDEVVKDLSDFDGERLALFWQTVGFLNLSAEDYRGMFEYTLDEREKTGSVRFVAKDFWRSTTAFFGKALYLALNCFPDLQITVENECIVICGTKSLEKEKKEKP